MTPDDLRAWQARMGYTYDSAAKALGVSRGTYADWIAGRSRNTGKPIKISRIVGLACSALAGGVGVWSPGDNGGGIVPLKACAEKTPPHLSPQRWAQSQ